MIFVSTGGYRNLTGAEAARRLAGAGVPGVELSGGAHVADPTAELVEVARAVPLRVHNYFPPPAQPFVFNLASPDDAIRTRSEEHVRGAVELTSALGAGVYSFHAGFLVDPDVDELGRPIRNRPLTDRRLGLDQFVETVTALAEEAAARGVTLLVENNVVSQANLESFGGDPLLMSTPDECVEVMERTPDSVRMLVDVAHLKVSATSLQFDPVAFLTSCDPWVAGYHLSDNDGTADTNEALTEGFWAWPHLRGDVGYVTLEVYGLEPEEQLSQVALTETMLGR